jgi:hypothetical protein
MKKNAKVLAALVVALTTVVHAQAPKEQVASVSARCDKEVRDYLETMKFIRESAGTQIGDRVAAGYIDEGALRKVQGEQGSCAAAQMIREKVARRG